MTNHEDEPCRVALALHDLTLAHRYGDVLTPAGYEVRILPFPIEMQALSDIDIVVVEVNPERIAEVGARLRASPRLFRGVIVGMSDAADAPERRRIAMLAGFNELLCGPCGPEALLELIEKLRTIRPDDVPCEPESQEPAPT